MSKADFPLPPNLVETVELLNSATEWLPEKLPLNLSLDTTSTPGQYLICGGDQVLYQADSEDAARSFLAGCFMLVFGGSSLQSIKHKLMPIAERERLQQEVLRVSGDLLQKHRRGLLENSIINQAEIPGRAEIIELMRFEQLPMELADDVTYVIHRFAGAPPTLNIEACRDLVGHQLSKPDRDMVVKQLHTINSVRASVGAGGR